MKSYHRGLLLAALLLPFASAPLHAQLSEEAIASTYPWSGWWWPAQKGHMILGYREDPGPLVKLDSLTGRHSSIWERNASSHFRLDGPVWMGHCHAWAAASVLEPEPRHDVVQGGIRFHVGDLKAYLTEAHYSDAAIVYGHRFNGNPGDDPQDMYPSLVWYVLRKYIYENKIAIVFDLDPGVQVWSYPVYRYKVSYQAGSDGLYQGQLTLWAMSDNVYPDDVGILPEEHDYTFTFRAQQGLIVPGSDRWTGDSVDDHPDFAWYPTERRQENPELDYSTVTQLNNQAR